MKPKTEWQIEIDRLLKVYDIDICNVEGGGFYATETVEQLLMEIRRLEAQIDILRHDKVGISYKAPTSSP